MLISIRALRMFAWKSSEFNRPPQRLHRTHPIRAGSAANANASVPLTTYSCFHMAPHSRSVDVISVMTESSTGTTVSNCLQTRRRGVKVANANRGEGARTSRYPLFLMWAFLRWT